MLLMLAASMAPVGCGTSGNKRALGAPACASRSDGGATNAYCLVEPRVVRVTAARSLRAGDAVLTNIDDNTAVIVARDALGFHALSAICTHACCLVSLCRDSTCSDVTSNPGECGTSEIARANDSATGIACPCHGSSFRLIDGSPTGGPARRALPSYAMAFDGNDALVDTARGADPGARV